MAKGFSFWINTARTTLQQATTPNRPHGPPIGGFRLSTTRLHAKAWMFHRRTGFSTAYVGSSNLTHSAMVTGLEWNVRVSGVRNPDVVAKMSAVFESYWASGDFVPFDPEEFRARTAAAEPEQANAGEEREDPRRKTPYGMVRLENGAQLMPYEMLINPPAVESNVLHWPWPQVKKHLDKLESLGKSYIGRRLYMMYNPMTGRTNGCTPSFFATITIRPPKIVDRPHRHTSAAINYYFHGRGRSTVEGKVYEWKAGDLMLSAPGWGVHNHASYDEPVYELTVQDQPLNIYMESLLWQEDLKHPAALLGSEAGFDTNRAQIAAAE